MAHVKDNVYTRGLSGMVGDQMVFRVRGKSTIVANAPVTQEHEPTVAQKAQQKHFHEAIIYGKSTMLDPKKKEAYQAVAEENQSAFNVAVADFLNAPSIESVDVSTYNGQPGNVITVEAVDDFNVTQVDVTIYNSDGTLVEHGLAIQQADGLNWNYTATVANVSLAGDKIVVKAYDLPGNLTEKQTTLT
jgi:hypothetical protein